MSPLKKWCKRYGYTYATLAKAIDLTHFDITNISNRNCGHFGKIYLVHVVTQIPLENLVQSRHLPFLKKAKELVNLKPKRVAARCTRKIAMDKIIYPIHSIFNVIDIKDNLICLESMSKQKHFVTKKVFDRFFREYHYRRPTQLKRIAGSEFL